MRRYPPFFGDFYALCLCLEQGKAGGSVEFGGERPFAVAVMSQCLRRHPGKGERKEQL